jgi:phosphoribosylformylglycinamidine synthase
VGLLAHLDDLIAGRPVAGDHLLVIGTGIGHLGQSALLAEAFGIEGGDAPTVDLAAEKAHGDFILSVRKHIRACTDLSDGGLGLAAFEMAVGAGLGVTLASGDIGALFGEDQARYVIAAGAENAAAIQAAAAQAGVSCTVAGHFGGDRVSFGGESAPLAALETLYRGAFAAAVA